MRFSRLVYTERRPAERGGRSITVDFELEEITVEGGGGGVRWCRLGRHERATVDAKLNSSRPESWAETYDARGGIGGERDARRNEEKTAGGVDWTLRLFDGAALVKSSHGTDRFPPGELWNAFRILTEFCFTVTRRYGAPPEAV